MLADKGELSPDDMITFTRTLKACKDIERIGDYGDNLIDFYAPNDDKKLNLKDSINYDIFVNTNKMVLEMIEKTLAVFETNNKDEAIKIIQERREKINDLEKVINKHFDVVTTNNNVSTNYLDYVFVDIINSYERVLSHCSNIAKLFGTDKNYIYTSNEEEHFNKMKDRY